MNSSQNKELISSTLEDMVGGYFLYGRTQIHIRDYRMDDEKERVFIRTDKKQFDRPYESVMDFLGQLDPVPERSMVLSNDSTPMVLAPARTITASVMGELRDTLMENIKKVKEDKNYMPQARAIKEQVDSVINLARAEIDYIHAVRKLNKD